MIQCLTKVIYGLCVIFESREKSKLIVDIDIGVSRTIVSKFWDKQ